MASSEGKEQEWKTSDQKSGGRGALLNFSGFLKTECKANSVPCECSAKGMYCKADFK